MKVIIAGTRTITDKAILAEALMACPKDIVITEVVSGCANGVDTLGELFAAEFNIPVKKFPAEWDAFGKAAGPRRNEQMARYADALIAVWDGQSRGTLDMIAKAKVRGLKVYVHQVAPK